MWKALSPYADSNDILEDIIDVLMECTVLVQDMGNLHTSEHAQELRKKCSDLSQQTHSWYETLQSTCEAPLYTMTRSTADIQRSTLSTDMFSERCEFVSVDIAEAHMLYWAALLFIHSLVYEMNKRKDVDPQSNSSSPGSPADSSSSEQGTYQSPSCSQDSFGQAELYANEICRGVGYFIQPHMHILGGHNLLFPVAMAAQFFYGNGFQEEYLWCQDVFAALESIGLGLAHVLQGTPWSRYKSAPVPRQDDERPCELQN